MNFNDTRTLGHTGLKVGRLGIASSYGAPAAAYEEAFEKGCNYFLWNTFIKGESKEMKKAIRNIVRNGNRDKLVIALHSYSHNAFLNSYFLKRSLKSLNIDYIDILILGYYSDNPANNILAGIKKLKEMGLTRFTGLSGHNRKLFPKLDKEGIIDVFHIRYNAANSGAEKDVFPYLRKENPPGIVAFTATRWGQLLKQTKMPPGETAPTAKDCYRFVLSNPAVDVCMSGTKNIAQMRENLSVLDSESMNEEELARMYKVGKYIYNK